MCLFLALAMVLIDCRAKSVVFLKDHVAFPKIDT